MISCASAPARKLSNSRAIAGRTGRIERIQPCGVELRRHRDFAGLRGGEIGPAFGHSHGAFRRLGQDRLGPDFATLPKARDDRHEVVGRGATGPRIAERDGARREQRGAQYGLARTVRRWRAVPPGEHGGSDTHIAARLREDQIGGGKRVQRTGRGDRQVKAVAACNASGNGRGRRVCHGDAGACVDQNRATRPSMAGRNAPGAKTISCQRRQGARSAKRAPPSAFGNGASMMSSFRGGLQAADLRGQRLARTSAVG